MEYTKRTEPRPSDHEFKQGLAISPGVVTGRVHLAPGHGAARRDPSDAIFVVGDLVGVGIQLRPAGVIAELGGPLSNAASTLRELGIPAVVLAGARCRLREGDLVRVDGAIGRVHFLQGVEEQT
jgi:phosphohistidine swiveling domain-containing protein